MAARASRIAKLSLFYLIFYCVLGMFVAIYYKLFTMTLDDRAPKWQSDKSIVGSTPGVTYRPSFHHSLGYNATDPVFARLWTEILDEFFEPYERLKEAPNVRDCDEFSTPRDDVCNFNIEHLGPCSKTSRYGLDTAPCIFLKLNKIYGWEPDCYHWYSYDLPQDTPTDLVHRMRHEEPSLGGGINRVWVHCGGVSSSDSRNLGNLSYYPSLGFPKKFFPYANVPGYVSPLVAVHFPGIRRHVKIDVECRVWARNIRHDVTNSKGGVRFWMFVN